MSATNTATLIEIPCVKCSAIVAVTRFGYLCGNCGDHCSKKETDRRLRPWEAVINLLCNEPGGTIAERYESIRWLMLAQLEMEHPEFSAGRLATDERAARRDKRKPAARKPRLAAEPAA